MKKSAGKMSNKELRESWKKGSAWMMTVEDDGELWKEGLERIEEIEDEMIKRKMRPTVKKNKDEQIKLT